MRLAVYIPSESEGIDIPEEIRQPIIDGVKRDFSTRYGGYTSHDAVGGWMNDEGELIEELVTVVYTFTQYPDVQSLETMGRRVAKLLYQDCVAIEVGYEMRFMEPEQTEYAAYDTPSDSPIGMS